MVSMSYAKNAALLALLATAEAAVVSGKQVGSVSAIRIMPLGDSITQWQCSNISQGGWRSYLGNAIHSGGFITDFIGEDPWVFTSRGHAAMDEPQWIPNHSSFVCAGSQYDCGSHEGHSGWTIAQLDQIANNVLLAHQPHVVLIQAGTNDLFFNQPNSTSGANVTGTLARMDSLLTNVFITLPQVTVLVSGVTYINATRCADYPQAPWHPLPCPADMQPNIVELNSLLPALVNSYAANGHNISFHDPNPECNFVAADYWTWGIHFSVRLAQAPIPAFVFINTSTALPLPSRSHCNLLLTSAGKRLCQNCCLLVYSLETGPRTHAAISVKFPLPGLLAQV